MPILSPGVARSRTFPAHAYSRPGGPPRPACFDAAGSGSGSGWRTSSRRGRARVAGLFLERGVERAARTLRGMTGLKVIEQKAKIINGAITEYRVYLAITFVLDD